MIPLIKSKDKILKKIEEDLKRRYYKSLKELENNKKISDFEIEAKVDIYDTLFDGIPIYTLHYGESMFEDDEPWTLSLFGIDLKVGRLCWYQLEALGLRSIQKRFYYWSEVKIRDQKFFEL